MIHRLGMGLSALCLVHCLALPWLLASLPVIALAALPEALRDSEWLHAALLAPIMLVSGPILLRRSPPASRVALVLVAFSALFSGLFVGSEIGEQALTVIGAALLLGAHWTVMHSAHGS
jgi:hypothetical protein